MVALFAVPVVAACVAMAVVLSRLRAIEEAATELAVAVRRTNEIRLGLAEVRRALDRSGPLVDRVWSHWR